MRPSRRLRLARRPRKRMLIKVTDGYLTAERAHHIREQFRRWNPDAKVLVGSGDFTVQEFDA